MSFNPPVKPAVRFPVGQLKVNGTVLAAWKSWTVDNNNFFSADSFRTTLAIAGLPPEFDQAWWGTQKTVEVEILAGFPTDPHNPQTAEMSSLIVGHVDDIDFDLAGRTLELHGRDLSAQLIDTKTTPSAYRNQTASQIAEQLAKKYGLTAQVTKTTQPVGAYWDMDHINLQEQKSEWDILTYLASQEDFIVSVKGRTLYFGDNPFGKPASDYYELNYDASQPVVQSNAKQISVARSLTIAKGVTVTAYSYQSKKKHAVIAAYPRATKGIGVGRATGTGGTSQNYRLSAGPNKTVAQVEAFAMKRYKEIVAHEMKLKATLPADHELTITRALKLVGTGTTWDQVYYPDSIVRTMSMDSGYTMEVSAKNIGPFSSGTV